MASAMRAKATKGLTSTEDSDALKGMAAVSRDMEVKSIEDVAVVCVFLGRGRGVKLGWPDMHDGQVIRALMHQHHDGDSKTHQVSSIVPTTHQQGPWQTS